MSLTLEGKLVQVMRQERSNNTFVRAVLETERKDRYNRPQVEEVQLSKNQLASGYESNMEKLIGVNVKLPVWVSAWSGKAGASFTLFLQDCDLNLCKLK